MVHVLRTTRNTTPGPSTQNHNVQKMPSASDAVWDDGLDIWAPRNATPGPSTQNHNVQKMSSVSGAGRDDGLDKWAPRNHKSISLASTRDTLGTASSSSGWTSATAIPSDFARRPSSAAPPSTRRSATARVKTEEPISDDENPFDDRERTPMSSISRARASRTGAAAKFNYSPRTPKSPSFNKSDPVAYTPVSIALLRCFLLIRHVKFCARMASLSASATGGSAREAPQSR